MEDHDLMFITDATSSMGSFLRNLREALPQIFDLVHLTDLVDRVSVIAFRDYCDKNLIEWSGWSNLQDADKLCAFVEKLKATGGGDIPEAVKTGLMEASKKVEKKTICVLYVDAPPHHKYKGENAGENYAEELKALGEDNFQWLDVCNQLRDRNMRVYPIFPQLQNHSYPFFVSLADITGGQCFEIYQSNILQSTIGVLLSISGVEFKHDSRSFSVSMMDSFVAKKTLASESGRYSQAPKRQVVQVKVIEDIKKKVGNPAQRFRTSEEYKSAVFAAFERLLTPERVMAFTYNTVFGKLWREICAQRQDPRREKLLEQFSRTVSFVSETDRSILQKFIDETYDQTEEIETILKSYGSTAPFYVIDYAVPMSRKLLFEIGRSCAPPAVQSVLKLLTGLRVTNKLPLSSRIKHLPVNMEPTVTFRLLPHLMCNGTMFTMRMSVVVAAIAKLAGSILKDDAEKYLMESKGKWIDFSLPENNSMDFARLMLKIAKEALTDEEEKYCRALIQVGSLMKAKNRNLSVETSYTSYKVKRPDYKVQCNRCKQWRSFTMVLDETCALCIEYPDKELLEPRKEKTSWMCECRTCLVHYAVFHEKNLKCKAKCHFCRAGETAPFVECTECQNKFLYQRSKPLRGFICAVCKTQGEKVLQKQQTSVESYIATNGAGFIGMKVDDVSKFFDSANSAFKMSADERLEAVRNFAEITEEDLAGHKFVVRKHKNLTKTVWNVKELQKQIYDFFSAPHLSQCMICFEDMPVNKLSDICGRAKKGCTVQACKTCLETWYHQMAPGRICQPAHLVCPYCKHPPVMKIVRKYNKVLCDLLNLMDIASFDSSFVHAWCMRCNNIKEAMPRECAREEQIIVNFKCDPCSFDPKDSRARQCPKCKIFVEKVGGCHHITCTCNAHWCWVCGALSTQMEIYNHISRTHRGFGIPDDFDEDFDDDDYADF